jgi:lysophospholipase L1-like esterase
MKLTHEQIKSIALGAAYVEEIDGRTIFHRFTKAQEDMYEQVKADFYNKTFATSGISLEFDTDSTSLYVKIYVKQRSSRRILGNSIFVDGKLCGMLNMDFDNIPDAPKSAFLKGKFLLGNTNDMKRVRFFLPWSASSEICELALDDGAILAPTHKKLKMISFGDSITQGYDAECTHNSYATKLAYALDAEARNKGIGGEFFRPQLAALKDEDFEPDIITVAYGTNDWYASSSFEKFHDHCKEFYDHLANNYPNAKIFAIAPIWRADHNLTTAVGVFTVVKETLREVITAHENITLIDAYDFVPHLPELFSDKFLHPNDEGFAYYADRLTEEIKKYL